MNKSNSIEKAIAELEQEGLWFWRFKDDSHKLRGEIWRETDCIFPTYFQGYHFNLKYYEDIKEIIQREFRPKIAINISRSLQQILRTENTVSLHIRRGDYLKLHCDISEGEYYPKAMEIIQSQIANPIYIVFSDDIEWVKNNFRVNGQKIYVSDMGFADYEELTIMKHCRHNIIANSTFSYWAAYLNSNPDKKVICPNRWMPEIIPKDWMRI